MCINSTESNLVLFVKTGRDKYSRAEERPWLLRGLVNWLLSKELELGVLKGLMLLESSASVLNQSFCYCLLEP